MVIGAQHRVIAIDGPAGAGKSTIAQALAKRLGIKYLDTGAMYRAITFEALLRKISCDDISAVASLAVECDLHVGLDRVIINGHDATEAIRGTEVTSHVSKVAANSAVRTEMRLRQQEWALSNNGGVIEGRDIATVVFPDALVKVFLTASPLIRAKRRVEQFGGDVDSIAASIAERDLLDSTRLDSPMVAASDAIVVDTSDRTIEDVVDDICSIYRLKVEQWQQ